jgi:polyhydroxybutyrate depolymerase
MSSEVAAWVPLSVLLVACSAPSAVPATPAPSPFRLQVCSEAPLHLEGPPEATQSRGCVAKFQQRIGTTDRERRYLVYAPASLPAHPVPVVLVFPGYTANAEAAAFYYTHTRFEELADRDGFVVVYGNGLPDPPRLTREPPPVPGGGFLQGCLLPHDGEGLDVAYVRRILDDLGHEIPLDRTRIYATGLSAGGGMAIELALEAPDLVAAVAPVAPLPFQPTGPWLFGCHPRDGYGRISIALLAATADPFISYGAGGSREYPDGHYPGMEATRDAWLQALGLSGPPELDVLPDSVAGDSYEPDSGRTDSTLERQRYGHAGDGPELWFYKADGAGHAWPNPTQLANVVWPRFGKTNQDIDFADEAWAFFQRHVKQR